MEMQQAVIFSKEEQRQVKCAIADRLWACELNIRSQGGESVEEWEKEKEALERAQKKLLDC